MVRILPHSQCTYKNTIVSEVSMIIKDTSACILESNPEWACAWLTPWPAFGCVLGEVTWHLMVLAACYLAIRGHITMASYQ